MYYKGRMFILELNKKGALKTKTKNPYYYIICNIIYEYNIIEVIYKYLKIMKE